jgi:hypothetical protein
VLQYFTIQMLLTITNFSTAKPCKVLWLKYSRRSIGRRPSKALFDLDGVRLSPPVIDAYVGKTAVYFPVQYLSRVFMLFIAPIRLIMFVVVDPPGTSFFLSSPLQVYLMYASTFGILCYAIAIIFSCILPVNQSKYMQI